MTTSIFSTRSFLLFLFALMVIGPCARGAGFTKGREVAPFSSGLKTGEYNWKPEISPAGPVVVVVSLPDQVMYVYRNGVRIGSSTVSTGAKGHATPTGVFVVLQKKVRHESTIYKGAQMPHMQRLTWTGICMHAGNLPGYPASHGCVRLPEDFAEKLFQVTSLGTTVIIADNKSGPGTTTKPGLIFSKKNNGAAPAGAVFWKPELAPKGPVTIMISRADGRVYVYRDGVEIGRAPVDGLKGFSGTYTYSALPAEASGKREWLAIASVGGSAPNLGDIRRRAEIDPQFMANVEAMVVPGTSLILTNEAVNAGNSSGPDFDVVDTDD
jgi:hypothetical protein